jgi:hypothetical protein
LISAFLANGIHQVDRVKVQFLCHPDGTAWDIELVAYWQPIQFQFTYKFHDKSNAIIGNATDSLNSL